MSTDSIATREALIGLGFGPTDAAASGFSSQPALAFDFGGFRLSAAWAMNQMFAQVVHMNGVLATRRTVAEVSFEMPLQVESREQCAAWIVWHLDKSSTGVFVPAREVDWILSGRASQMLLPWVAEQAAYQARPHCSIRRDWMRLTLMVMAETLATAPAEASVAFAFDGAVLKINCAGRILSLPAQGSAWSASYSIPAARLQHLPKRLNSDSLELSIWKGRLTIASCAYEGAVESAST